MARCIEHFRKAEVCLLHDKLDSKNLWMKERPVVGGQRVLRHRLKPKHSYIEFSKVRKIPIDSDAFTSRDNDARAASNSDDYAFAFTCDRHKWTNCRAGINDKRRAWKRPLRLNPDLTSMRDNLHVLRNFVDCETTRHCHATFIHRVFENVFSDLICETFDRFKLNFSSFFSLTRSNYRESYSRLLFTIHN